MTRAKAKKTTRNHRPVKAISRTTRLPLVLIIGTILLALSLLVNIRSQRLSASQMLGGSSSAFHGRHIQDILLPPNESEARVLAAGTTPFTVNYPPDAENVGVFFSYKCEPSCLHVWFEYPTINNDLVRQPVEHPIFSNLQWPRLILTSTVIFQKNIQVLSIQELAQSQSNILTEKHLAHKYKLTSPNIKFLEDTTSLEGIDIIFTSWLPQPPQGTGKYYYTVVNTQQVKKSSDKQLIFQINTDQPTKLLKLEVTYQEELR